jgi:antitoxin (DNA-binding transcriptional repressor) of toxin-antitoxin stability system
VPRIVDLEELPEPAGSLVQAVAAGEYPIVVRQAEQPVAVIASHESVLTLAAMVSLPQWDEWLNELRMAFPNVAISRQILHQPAPPEEVDKGALGFDLASARVGSADGREHLSSELRRLGVPIVDESLLATIYARVLELCEAKERVFRADLKALAQEMIAEAPQRLKLHALTVQSTTGLPAMAEVTLELGQGPAMRREHGDGPLDAAFKAIEKLAGLQPELENFTVVTATKGRDAIAEAMIELSLEGGRVIGAGYSTNAVEAGVLAYLNALNFLLETRREVAAT